MTLLHPERIHPALWRGAQLIQGGTKRLPSGNSRLDRALGGGWPLGTLIEILPQMPGIGEVRLVGTALAGARDCCPRIVLLAPPHLPSIQCWASWGLSPDRLLWIQTQTSQDTLWAASQVLHYQTGAALLCWVGQAPYAALVKLCRLAARSAAPTLLYRSGLPSASPAKLRLRLLPAPEGIHIHFLKRPTFVSRTAGSDLIVHWHERALDQPAAASAPGSLPGTAGTVATLHAAIDTA